MTVYGISGVDYNSTYFPVSGRSINPGPNVVRTKAGGSIFPTHSAITTLAPGITFDSHHIAAVLGVTGIGGAAISSGALLTAFSRKFTDGVGGYASGTNHIKHVVNKGLMLPRSINASNESATISVEAIPVYDGSNECIVITNSNTFAGTQVVSERFMVGPISINGTTVNNVQSITVDFGITENLIKDSGSIRNTFGCIVDQRPTISFTTTDVSFITTTTAVGVEQGATDSIVYLRKIDDGGTVVADATAEHISFTIDKGIICCTGLSGDDSETATFMIYPDYDNSNAIIVLDASVAIS